MGASRMADHKSNQAAPLTTGRRRRLNAALLLLVAGLGGLLYGVDVGIIGGALPYLAATSGLSAQQLSIVVAAVLLGSVLSTLFAGLLADWMGRKLLMTLSGAAFVLSIPVIALSHGYEPLFLGRLLQGVSGGIIGVVVPLYLAECLPSSNRGKGTGLFQWLLTLGIVAAALIGIYYSYRVEAVAQAASAAALFHFKDQAWRRIFWISLPPGLLFVLGTFFVGESPRWLFRHAHPERALRSLLRTRTSEQAAAEMQGMEQAEQSALVEAKSGKSKGTIFQGKYMRPFVLACVILFCNTATGINPIIAFNTGILLQSGLTDIQAHWGYVIFTVVNSLLTIGGMMLVDRKGRRFLLILGTSGVIVSLVVVGLLFVHIEKGDIECQAAVQQMVTPDQRLTLHFTPAEARRLLADTGQRKASPTGKNLWLVVTYSYGGFTSATTFVRSDDASAAPIRISRSSALPASRAGAFFENPTASLSAARTAPLKIDKARIGTIPSQAHGWLIEILLDIFVAFYAVGPGVVVWLALSELMPTRIRSNGMSIALVINQLVAATLAGIFLPVVSEHGYSVMFFLFTGFSVIYFLTAFFFLPETKGKTLEEIEEYFEHRSPRAMHGKNA